MQEASLVIGVPYDRGCMATAWKPTRITRVIVGCTPHFLLVFISGDKTSEYLLFMMAFGDNFLAASSYSTK
jgi:hypothetical protein